MIILSGCATTYKDNPDTETPSVETTTAPPNDTMRSFYKAGKIQQFCSRIGQVTSDLVVLQEAGVCIGYIAGIVDHEAIMVINGTKTPGFCIPEGVSTKDVVAVLKQLYIREDGMQATGSDWIAKALSVAYPPSQGLCDP